MALVCGRFDPTGELYATLTTDSRLKIWETATGNLRQEHTPTTHLADAYTCVAWGHAKVRTLPLCRYSLSPFMNAHPSCPCVHPHASPRTMSALTMDKTCACFYFLLSSILPWYRLCERLVSASSVDVVLSVFINAVVLLSLDGGTRQDVGSLAERH